MIQNAPIREALDSPAWALWFQNLVSMFRPVTVAKLPRPALGARAFVTDATATTFGDVVSGGGTNPVPVYSDGLVWRVG
jgi:hypothetical protein